MTIFVTQPSLPPLNEYVERLEEIWRSKILSNCGPQHQALEDELAQYLGVKYVSLFNNCTIGLMTALQALEIHGEVITTPYSFVATAHSILWRGLTPVFVDVEDQYFNINPDRIEEAITPKTSAILAVHCYGHPCKVEEIKIIADKYKLKVIYDSAHAFGVKRNDTSILNYGDLSVLSFHATKVFNTFEGGAIICHDLETKKKIDRLKNFGFVDEANVENSGLNGKMCEPIAAFGRVQLAHVGKFIKRRQEIDARYRLLLKNVKGISCLKADPEVSRNCSYFPVVVNSDYPLDRDTLCKKMKENDIHVRRYFYPLITQFPMYHVYPSSTPSNLPIASDVAQKILCLPMYSDLTEKDQIGIVSLIADEVA